MPHLPWGMSAGSGHPFRLVDLTLGCLRMSFGSSSDGRRQDSFRLVLGFFVLPSRFLFTVSDRRCSCHLASPSQASKTPRTWDRPVDPGIVATRLAIWVCL